MFEQHFQDDSSSSSLPLVPDSEKYNNHVELGQMRQQMQSPRKASWKPVLVHAVIFCSYMFATMVANLLWMGQQDCHAKMAFTPARGALNFKRVAYNGDLHKINPFRGPPRPELDEAWHNLLENNNIRLSDSEIKEMDRPDTIQLADGSGYFGQLSAYHHLHCLKFIRQVMHPEYYTGLADKPDTAEHVDHCFDDIRQALMCHPDTSVVTFDWKSDSWRRPWPNFKVDHECVDWELLDQWASQRSFSIFDQKSIVHPKLGLSFPLINGTIEDVANGPGMHIVWPE